MMTLGATGLIYDLIGVLIVARAIAFTRTRTLGMQASTKWNLNEELLRALLEQRFDARYGLAIIAMGFVIQIIAAIPGLSLTYSHAVWLPLVLVVVGYFCFRRYLVKASLARAIARVGAGEVTQGQVVLQSQIFG